jgi:branched-chain amino acid transport system substrate-binding protein
MTDFRLNRRHALQAAAATGSALWLPGAMAQETGDIKIGQSTHLTGPLAPSFLPVLKGQALAFDEINRKGGINGRPIKLVLLDDAYDPKKAIENTNKLIDDEKVVGLFGYASTANVAAVLPLLAEKKVPLIGAYGGSPMLRVKQHPFFFTNLASYKDEVVQMIRNLVATQKTSIGLIYQNHPFGQQMLPVVEEVAKEFGATVVAKHALEVNGSDAVAAVQAVGQGKPQAVLLMAFGPSTVAAIKAVRTYIGVPIYAVSIANSKQLVAALGDDGRGMAYTQVIPYPWRQTTALTREFGQVMGKHDLPIDYDHFIGYLNARVLIEGLKRAAAKGKKGITPAALTAGMEAIGKFDLGGYPLNFGPTRHHGSNFVEITIVGPNGRYMR